MVLALIDDEFRPKPFLFWTDVGSVLGSRMHRLREAFSENNYPELKERLLDMHQYERAAIKQWQTEINRKLHSD